MSRRAQILRAVKLNPGMTAWQLSKVMKYDAACVSSQLNVMVRKGWVTRVQGYGPRKGWGYFTQFPEAGGVHV